MVNLLFITNNSRIDIIKNALQPLLKVKIDIVGDFDFGLKDVFEKRPSTVFIQDQIDGVTGESVARHIQMLLGSGAPSFIFMHEGNIKAKPVKGLYEFLIDLSQDDANVLEDIQSTLKSILGPQWQKIYIPPAITKSVVKTALTVPEEHRASADQLVEDFISDLGDVSPETIITTYPLADFSSPESSSDEAFNFVSSHHDQLAEIMSETDIDEHGAETAAPPARDVTAESTCEPPVTPSSSLQNKRPAAPEIPTPAEHKDVPAAGEVPPIRVETAPSGAAVQKTQALFAANVSGESEKQQPSSLSPANFRIGKDLKKSDIPTDATLQVFDAKYPSKTTPRKSFQVIAIIVVMCLLGGGGYLIKRNPHLMQDFGGKTPPVNVPAAGTQPVPAVPVEQKPVSTVQRPNPAVLPSIIPLTGHDPSFASQKPGWERYVGADSEFRVFRSGGKFKAVQVLSTDGGVISESKLKSLLTDLTGSGEYRVTSQEQKHGFHVSRATIVNGKADLLIYRKKSSIHAFVVSFE
jgi:hypothetical protein